MAIELDQDIMVTNMCLKFGEDWTNGFQELDRKQSSGRTYVQTYRQTDVRTYGQGQPYMPPLCGGHNKYFKKIKIRTNSIILALVNQNIWTKCVA